ncbi:hypothetical protein Nans01_41890 [Nocardiopsis ansamitocini]|uniref:Uncharacterized protein n=1 Tax=Nocardiopsis ansamitocini TaxID=1670832 RepID=A0A9W6PA89_9ACTN|nr:hypothetical protein Nans01_41890 [Nocardiopsis ansamitocini]
MCLEWGSSGTWRRHRAVVEVSPDGLAKPSRERLGDLTEKSAVTSVFMQVKESFPKPLENR